MKRFLKVLVLSIAMPVLFWGSAWAADFDWTAPYASWLHTSRAEITDGKSDYSDAEFMWMELTVRNTPVKNGGSITLNAKEPAHIEYWSSNLVWDEILEGEKTFPLWVSSNNEELWAGDENGAMIELWEHNEHHRTTQTAFSGQPFSVGVEDVRLSGTFPKIRSTKMQMDDVCVPYFELITDKDAAMVTGVKWRFVDANNPDVAVKKNDTNHNVKNLRRIQVRLNDSGRTTYNEQMDIDFNIGDSMQGTKMLSVPVATDQILYVRAFYYLEDNFGDQGKVEYTWRFYADGTVPLNNQPNPAKPTDEEVEAARAAAGENLAKAPAEVIAVEQESIRTGTDITFKDGEITKSNTSSIIAVSQDVTPGGAVLLAAAGKLTMPANSKSLSGADLEIPKNLDDLKEKGYTVIKHFEKGGNVDLLKEYGNRAFSYSENTGVTLEAALVIIDDKAPSEVSGDVIIRPESMGDGEGGVMLSSDNKYLYVWDGDRNGMAKDPIALVKIDDGGDVSSGSSGCNAGLGIFILLACAAPIAMKKRQ